MCHDVITKLVAVLKLLLKMIRCHPKKPASPQSDTGVGTGRLNPNYLGRDLGTGLTHSVFRGAVLVQIVEELFKTNFSKPPHPPPTSIRRQDPSLAECLQ